MVGGAVLTQEYADMIHADFYSKDTMGSVYCAKDYLERIFCIENPSPNCIIHWKVGFC